MASKAKYSTLGAIKKIKISDFLKCRNLWFVKRTFTSFLKNTKTLHAKRTTAITWRVFRTAYDLSKIYSLQRSLIYHFRHALLLDKPRRTGTPTALIKRSRYYLQNQKYLFNSIPRLNRWPTSPIYEHQWMRLENKISLLLISQCDILEFS